MRRLVIGALLFVAVPAVALGAAQIAAPRHVHATKVTRISIGLAWTGVKGAHGYDVSNGSRSGVTVTSHAYTFYGLSCGTRYTLGVAARGLGTKSRRVTVRKSTKACPGLTAPAGLSILNPQKTSLTLTWHPVAGARGYQALLNGKSVATTFSPIYTFTGLKCGKSYTLGVRATAIGKTSPAATKTFKTAACG